MLASSALTPRMDRFWRHFSAQDRRAASTEHTTVSRLDDKALEHELPAVFSRDAGAVVARRGRGVFCKIVDLHLQTAHRQALYVRTDAKLYFEGHYDFIDNTNVQMNNIVDNLNTYKATYHMQIMFVCNLCKP
jgi:hypothetical protein